MRRILIFSLAYFPKNVGGAEIAIKEITDRISPLEIEFDMVTLHLNKEDPKEEKIGNVMVYRIGTGSFFDKILFPIIGTFRVLQLLKTEKYDAFWVVMFNYVTGSAYIVNILRKLFGQNKIPIIATLQEGDSEKHLKFRHFGLLSLSWKLALKRTYYLTTISNYLHDRALKYGYKGKFILIPNAVNYNLFSNKISLDEKNILRKKMDLNIDDIYMITTSRLVEKNDILTLIESLKYLSSNIKLLILGNGKQEKMLKEKVKESKLDERVKFLGYISHAEMPTYLHISDIFIRPALSEGFGNSYIEAMAAGIPVIATPVGGIVDFLKDGETGLLCEVKNPRSIAQKVEKLIKDKESRDYIVKNASQMVKEKYDWDLIANRMKNEVFLKVL